MTFELTFHSNPEATDIQFTLYDLDGPVNMTVNASTLTRVEEDIVEERYTFSPVVRVSEYFSGLYSTVLALNHHNISKLSRGIHFFLN